MPRDSALIFGPNWNLPNDFWVSDHRRRTKLDGQHLKRSRVQLAELGCSMVHPTTVHLLPLSLELKVSVPHGEDGHDWNGDDKSEENKRKMFLRLSPVPSLFLSTTLLFSVLFSSFCQNVFSPNVPSYLVFLASVSCVRQTCLLGSANSLSMSYQGQCKNNAALWCRISCFS